MYDNVQSDSESSESDESEYCVHSSIKLAWLQDYESGNFGNDYPIDKPKLANLSKEFLTDVLKKVRSKQNAQSSTEFRNEGVEQSNDLPNTTATQHTIQLNGIPNTVPNSLPHTVPNTNSNGFPQMTAPQPVHSTNVPLPYKPFVNPSDHFGFPPNPNPFPSNPNQFPPTHNVPTIDQRFPIPNAACAYYQQPPKHYNAQNNMQMQQHVVNIFGCPINTQPQNVPLQPQNLNFQGNAVPPPLPHQHVVHHSNVLSQNIQPQYMPTQNAHQPSVPYRNVLNQNPPLPHGMQSVHIERPTDPRLRREDQPMRNQTRWKPSTPPMIVQPNTQKQLNPPMPPMPPMPSIPPMPPMPPMRPMPSIPPMPPIAPIAPVQKAALIAYRRRISIADYRRYVEDPAERSKDKVVDRNDTICEQRPDQHRTNVHDANGPDQSGTVHGIFQTNGDSIPFLNEHTNDNDTEPEPTFSPTSSSPATTAPPTPIPDEFQENDENRNVILDGDVDVNENVGVKEIVVKSEENDDYDSDASVATIEFTIESYRRDVELKELDDDAVTEIVGDLSPQYVIEEEPEFEHANEVDFEYVNEVELEQVNEVESELVNETVGNFEIKTEENSDSNDLLMPVPTPLMEQTRRCYIILEDIGHLINKYNRNDAKKKKKKKKKKQKQRKRIIRSPDTGSESEVEEEEKAAVLERNSKSETETLKEPVPQKTKPEPVPKSKQVQLQEEENIPAIEGPEADELSEIIISSDENNEDGNDEDENNNEDGIVYEISSDTDDE